MSEITAREAWDQCYSQAVADHKMRSDGDAYCDWPMSPNPHTLPPTTDPAETVSGILATHASFRPSGKFCAGPNERWFCGCGEQIDEDPSGRDILARHRRHVAEQIVMAVRHPEALAAARAAIRATTEETK